MARVGVSRGGNSVWFSMAAIGLAVILPLLVGLIGSGCDCDDDDDGNSTGVSKHTSKTSRNSSNNVDLVWMRDLSGPRTWVTVTLEKATSNSDSSARLTWNPPAGATDFSFPGKQPDNPDSGPPFHFSNVPVGAGAESGVRVEYTPPSVEQGHMFVDSFTVKSSTGEEGFSAPYRWGGKNSRVSEKVATEEGSGSAWQLSRWWYAVPGYDLNADLARQVADLLEEGMGFIGVEAPVPSGYDGFRIPLIMLEGDAPVLELMDYRQDDFAVAGVPVTWVPDYQEFLENSFPARDDAHWFAVGVPEQTSIELPSDFPIPAGSWEIYGNMLLDFSAMDNDCDGCDLRFVACVDNSVLQPGLRAVISQLKWVAPVKSYQDGNFTCVGPYSIALNTESTFQIGGTTLVKADPGESVAIGLHAETWGSGITVSRHVESDRGRVWDAYEGDWDGPDLSSPLPAQFSFSSLKNIWLVADIPADDQGIEGVTLTLEPVGGSEAAQFHTTTVVIGEVTPPPGQWTTWIPVASHAAGAAGSAWRTDLGLLNPEASAAEATVTIHANDGDHDLTVEVPPSGQVIAEDFLADIPFDGTGSVEVVGPHALIATSRIYNEIGPGSQCLPGGTLGQFLDSSDNVTVLSAGQSAWIPQLVQTSKYRTNLALTNTGDGEARATIRMYDAGGTELGNYETVLTPGKWEQKNRVFTFFTSSDVPAGYAVVEVTAGAGVIGYGSVVDNATNDPTTMPMVPMTAASTDAWIPVAVHAAGANGSQWRTDLGILNPGADEQTVEVVLHTGDGDLTMDVTVVGGGQAILQDVVGLLPYDGAGSLQVTADEGVVVTSRTYTEIAADAACYPGGTLGQFLDSSAGTVVLEAGQSARIPQLVQTGAYRTNVAFTNTGDTEAAVTVRLYDGAGVEVGSYDVVLAPAEWAQKNRVFTFFTGSDVPAGYAVVEVTEGSGVIGYGSVVDNTTNDPTTMPMTR